MQTSAAASRPLEQPEVDPEAETGTDGVASGDGTSVVPVAGSSVRPARPSVPTRRGRARRLRLVRADESGTTTAEYSVVTAAAVAFGALLLKLLTGSWGQKILETAFREIIKMLGH